MSLEKNNEFLTVFNTLDDVLKTMYPDDTPSKLGVTRYIEDMREKEGAGIVAVPNWKRDYDRLRTLRNNRTKVVHDNMLADDVFDDGDIAWITGFKNRLMGGEDPISMLNDLKKKQAKAAAPIPKQKQKRKPKASDALKNKTKEELEREIWEGAEAERPKKQKDAPERDSSISLILGYVIIAFIVICIIGCIFGKW